MMRPFGLLVVQVLRNEICKMRYIHERKGQYWDVGRSGFSSDNIGRKKHIVSLFLPVVNVVERLYNTGSQSSPTRSFPWNTHPDLYSNSTPSLSPFPSSSTSCDLSSTSFLPQLPGWMPSSAAPQDNDGTHCPGRLNTLWINRHFYQLHPKTLPFSSEPQG